MLKRLSVPVRRIEADPGPDSAWWDAIPAVRQLLRDGLDLGRITVLVGENGSGKSTLTEAIAMAYGMNAEGGSTGARHRTRHTESGLSEQLRLIRGAGAAKRGFFLRAETMHAFFSYLEDNPGARPEPRFHRMSHGESFRALAGDRFRQPGLYVLDEPESALSFANQLWLLRALAELAADDEHQVLLATHSPVLAAIPGAVILELDEHGWTPRAYDDLAMVSHYRAFLSAPQRYLRHLLD